MDLDLTGTIPNTSPQQSILREIRKLEGRLQKIETRIGLLEEKPAPLELIKKDNPFEFKIGEKMWTLYNEGSIIESTYDGSPVRDASIDQGHVFKSLELAERERNKRLLIQEIEKWKWENDGKFNLMNGGDCGVIEQEVNSDDRLFTDSYRCASLNSLFFKSEEMAIAAKKHFGDRLKILFLPKYTI